MRAAPTAAGLALALLLPQAAGAQETRDRVELTYGAGLVGVSGVYVGEDDALLPYPHLAATYGNLTVSLGGGVEYALWTGKATTLSAALTYEGAPDLPDTALFAGLDRDDWIAAELALTHDLGLVDLALGLRADVSGTHDGGAAEVSVGRGFALGTAVVEGRIGASYMDARLAGHLFGVAPSEATALRAAYAPGASWTPHLDLSILYPLPGGTMIGGFFRHEALPNSISRSPLVGADERTILGLNLVRQF